MLKSTELAWKWYWTKNNSIVFNFVFVLFIIFVKRGEGYYSDENDMELKHSRLLHAAYCMKYQW